MLFCFQLQHAYGITLLTGPGQAVDGTTALSVQTGSWYFVSLSVCAHNLSRIKREAHMSSHRFSTEDVKHAALWRENYILLFFFSSSIIQHIQYTYIYKETLSSFHFKTSTSRVNLQITIIFLYSNFSFPLGQLQIYIYSS